MDGASKEATSNNGGRKQPAQTLPLQRSMKSVEEIAEKFSLAATDLINAHAREIERIRDENANKVILRFACTIRDHAMKTRLSFGISTKDEIQNQLDGDQATLPGMERTKRKKKSVSTEG